MNATIERRLKLLPAPVKYGLKRASSAVDPALRWNYRRASGDDRPVPPAELRARIGSGIDVGSFVRSGGELAAELDAALRAQGTSLAERDTIWDWGCGCGRLLAHLPSHAGAGTRIMGSDIDPEAVAWVARTFPRMHVVVNGFEPPLPVGDGAVDCLISSSIFTHLTAADQDRWLAELQRVIAPGGYGLVSTLGARGVEHFRNGEWASRGAEFTERMALLPPLAAGAIHFEPYERSRWEERDFAGVTGVYGLTFHDPGYVREHWGRWFDVLDHREAVVNGVQDLVVLRRRER